MQLVKPVKAAIKILKSLYLGDGEKTYQSMSLKCQIDFYMKDYIARFGQLDCLTRVGHAVAVGWVAGKG
jgi:hypothetical protein